VAGVSGDVNWELVALLTFVSLPGLLWVTPRTIRTVQSTAENRLDAEQDLPSFPVLVAVSVVQSTVLVTLAAAVGAFGAR